MKRLTTGSLALIICFTVLLCFGMRAEAATSDKINVKVELGFNNNYKIGYSAPINMTIDNKYKDIQGEVEIRVPSSSGKYVSYVKQLSMQKDSQKSITINVPIGGNRINYKVLIHNGKDIVYQDEIKIDNTANNVTEFIGILSEDKDSLTYINLVPSPKGMSVLTKPIMLNEKNFPEDFLVLKNFSILVVNNFDTTKLSKTQYEVIKQWVKDGGTLLIGTGSNHAKTLGAFKDDFIKGSIGKVTTVNTSKINNLATNGDNNSKVNMDVLDMNIENSKTNMVDVGVNLVQSLSIGKGVVGVVAFDLGQSPFVGWNNNSQFAQRLLEIINPKLIDLNQGMNKGLEQNTYMLRDIMNQFSELGSAKTSNFYIIIFIYILVVAPLSYIVLKKLDKRELMWITVPVIAIIFGFIVFVSGAGGRINKVTANVVSTIYIDKDGNSGVSTYGGIFTPKKMKLKVQSKEGKKLFNISEPNYGDPSQSTTNADLEAKVYTDGNGGIEYYNTSILQNAVVQIQQQNLALGKIAAEIKIKENGFTGEVKNSTKLALEDCYILTPSEYYKIGDLKVGESKTLTAKSGTYQGNINEFANQIFMNNGNYNTSGMTQSNDNLQKMFMFNLMFNQNNATVDGITFVGFSKTAIEAPLIINNGAEAVKNERNILVMPLTVSFKEGNNVNYPLGFVPYEIVPGSTLQYEIYSKRFNGNGIVEIEYSIDKEANIETIDIELDKLSYKGVDPIVKIYNITNNSYEEIKNKKITGDVLKKYLDKNNKFKINLQVTNGDSAIPKVSANGKVK